MNSFLKTVRDRMEKHARYTRTLNELQNLPPEIAEDLGIYPGDAQHIARQAVYG